MSDRKGLGGAPELRAARGDGAVLPLGAPVGTIVGFCELAPGLFQVELGFPTEPGKNMAMESFFISAGTVALAEIGDKTQLATVALAAHYSEVVPVVVGTTLGMLIADVPAVFAADRLAHTVPLKIVRVLLGL